MVQSLRIQYLVLHPFFYGMLFVPTVFFIFTLITLIPAIFMKIPGKVRIEADKEDRCLFRVLPLPRPLLEQIEELCIFMDSEGWHRQIVGHARIVGQAISLFVLSSREWRAEINTPTPRAEG